jgi:diguanylate cyclase (GGDEF)-like protein/PAS domain S-box-containing protein
MGVDVPGCARRWLRIHARPVFEAGSLAGVVSSFGDVTLERELLQAQAAMLNNDMIGIVRIKDRVAIWSNAGMERLFGYGPGELRGHASRQFYPSQAAYEALGAAAYPVLAAGGTFRTQQQLLRQDGSLVWVELIGRRLSADSDESLWLLSDISLLKAQQQHIEHLAQHDALTGLPNRLLLQDRIEQALALAARDGHRVAVCYLDLDDFKPVNDQLGHAAGDEVLRTVAERLLGCVRGHDTVCRLGGDEFLVVLTQLGAAADFEPVLRRLLHELRRPTALPSGQEVGVSVSAGIALYPDDGEHEAHLMQLADRALYGAKAAGGGCWQRTSGRSAELLEADEA